MESFSTEVQIFQRIAQIFRNEKANIDYPYNLKRKSVSQSNSQCTVLFNQTNTLWVKNQQFLISVNPDEGNINGRINGSDNVLRF